jgi:hypothetical protein
VLKILLNMEPNAELWGLPTGTQNGPIC